MNTESKAVYDAMAEVVTHIISSTITVETTVAMCPELKQYLMETLIFEEYVAWHKDHLDDIKRPPQFLYDLVLWTQERTRYHISLSAQSQVVN